MSQSSLKKKYPELDKIGARMETPPRKSLAKLTQLTSVPASLPQNVIKLQHLCFTNSTTHIMK
jgi:hypothetical protein